MILRLFYGLLLAALLSGCAAPGRSASVLPSKKFDFAKDTFTYANELTWIYYRDSASGEMKHRKQSPEPEYTLHCFVVARATKQFFLNARFAPEQPKVPEATYRDLIRQVRLRSPRVSGVAMPVIIPGYADLKSFSKDYESILKEECGGAWLSYTQRGHWRMLLPFTRQQRAGDAVELKQSLDKNGIAVAHVVTFPELSINHAVVLYAYEDAVDEIKFTTYDPNSPKAPTVLTFDKKTNRFTLPENNYFGGGVVNCYEVFHRWNY